MSDNEKILTINFGGIGDEILFLPAIISLKKEFPNAEITLALEPRSRGIKDLSEEIADIITVDIKSKNKFSELIKLIIKARKGKFDTVISSGASPFISIILFLTGIKKRYGYDTGALSRRLLTKAIPLNKNQYACAMYHDLVSTLTNNKTQLPKINITPGQKLQDTVLIHPGVSKMSIDKGMVKTIGAPVWAQVIDLLLNNGKKVILAGGPDDKECIDIIRKTVKNNGYEDYYGKTKNLRELAELITKAEKFICSDSAPLHIGVAVGTKTYVIFGPTDDKKLIPLTDNVIPIKAQCTCTIKPCLWESRQTTCESLECLKISAQDIVNTVLAS